MSIISKKELTFKKTLNNTRIIVVGASDTGISFLESLLTLKEVILIILLLYYIVLLIKLNYIYIYNKIII